MLVRAKQTLDQSVPIVMLWQAQRRDVIVHQGGFDESDATPLSNTGRASAEHMTN